jgi:hypothetical protein
MDIEEVSLITTKKLPLKCSDWQYSQIATHKRKRLHSPGQSSATGGQMSYPDTMDHLNVLREKIGRLRAEIAHIQELNEQYRHGDQNETEARIEHGQRQERLQAIQQELAQLAGLGRKVLSVEEIKEKHRFRLHLVKKAS